MRGNWNEVWDSFDKRKAAKASAANEDMGDRATGGADMFAGVAAE